MPAPPTPADIAAARRALADRDPALGRVDAVVPPFPWREAEGGFVGLVRLIVDQQVSLAAGAAIWKRVEDGLGGAVTAEGVLARDIETLRGYGLSLPKARYFHEIARAQTSGFIDLEHLESLPDEEAVARLCAIKGVGLWTAETYLMFCQGRLDVFPGGDVALQEAMRWMDRQDTRPNQKAAYARAEAWRPYRGVAAHLLWAWYGAVKRGELSREAA